MVRISLLLPPLLVLAACDGIVEVGTIKGSGNIVTEARPVGKFTAIRLSGIGQVVVEPGQTESLTVTVDDNLLPLFASQVENGTLYLTTTEGKNPGRAAIFKVAVSDLRAVTVNGSGSIEATKADAATLSISVAGSGSAKVAGRTDSVTVSLQGSGTVDAAGLNAKRAKVAVTGSGDVTVNAGDELEARLSGSGDIRYIGAPRLTSHITGTGKIERVRQ
jgi:hypothetical protein